MKQIELARNGEISEAVRHVAEEEGYPAGEIRDKVASGKIVIPRNIKRDFAPRGIGEGLRTKVNANIGTSGRHIDLKEELDKLRMAEMSGADAVMDLSTGGNLREIRRTIIAEACIMVGTVPIYGIISEMQDAEQDIFHMDPNELFDHIEQHCEDGVDFITVHCGVTRQALEKLKVCNRLGGIVSRGGSMLAAWMTHNRKENPLYEQYDRLLEIVGRYDVTLSLGDGLRPGAIADATDAAQIEELATLGELYRRAVAVGVQAMIEGPGHVPLAHVEANVLLEKRLCDGAPFYVLGPLTTDIAPGYDHITGAIGGAIAAAAGADFLCYVTPAEHLRLPTVRDVREGVIASRIAAHSGDIAKGVKGAMDWDNRMSGFRKQLDWEGMYSQAIDPARARSVRQDSENYEEIECTMCGKLCSIKLTNEYL